MSSATRAPTGPGSSTYLGLHSHRGAFASDDPVSAGVGGWLRETRTTPAVTAGKDGGMTMHADQLHVDVDTVRRLVAAQFPQWRGLPVTELRTPGTVNAIFRIG